MQNTKNLPSLSSIWDRLVGSGRTAVTGLDLAAALAELHREERTGVLGIRSGEQAGWIGLSRGELVGATCPGADAEAAVRQILTWPEPAITLEGVALRIDQMIRAPFAEIVPIADTSLPEPGRDDLGVVEVAPADEIDWDALGLPPPEEAFVWSEREASGAAAAPATPASEARPLWPPPETEPSPPAMEEEGDDLAAFIPAAHLPDDTVDWSGLDLPPLAAAFTWNEPDAPSEVITPPAPTPSVPAAPPSSTPPAPESPPRTLPFQPAAIEAALERAYALSGFVLGALVDRQARAVLAAVAAPDVETASFDLARAAQGNSRLLNLQLALMDRLGVTDAIEDILFSLSDQYHLICPISTVPTVFLYLVFDRRRINLGLVRVALQEIVADLEHPPG